MREGGRIRAGDVTGLQGVEFTCVETERRRMWYKHTYAVGTGKGFPVTYALVSRFTTREEFLISSTHEGNCR